MKFTIQDNILKSYDGRDYQLTLPEHITEIDSFVFSGNKLLQSIQLGNKLVKLGIGAFYGCELLKTIEIPEGVTCIGSSCFCNCSSLECVVIPEGVTRIEESTFSGCSSLNEVRLPSTIEYIGKTAFNNCQNLINIRFKTLPEKIESNAFNGCARLYENTGMIVVGQTIRGYSGKEGVLKIPPTVTAIAPGAFAFNKDLVEVEIPGSIEVISEHAFMGCENLTKVKLNEGLRKLCVMAFDHCQSIEEIIVPDSVVSIGDEAFGHCKNLKYVKLPSTLNSISESMFYGCGTLENIDLPSSAKSIMSWAFSSTGIREIDLSNIVFIDDSAFGWSKVERIVLGNHFRKIQSHMLDNCLKLRHLYIPDSVTEIEGWEPEFAEETTIPFIHVSSKLLKGLDDGNKLNAVSTFIQTQDTYSEEGRKSWVTYIKRYKVKLLKMCIDGAREELYWEILNMVSLSDANVDEIKEYIKKSSIENVEQFYNEKLTSTDFATKKPTKKISGSVLAQLIASIPRSASAVKKVYLLEAATLFGTYEDLLAVIEKYQSFEFTKGAVLIAFQLKQLKKMAVLLGISESFCNGNHSSLKGKYGDLVDTWFEGVIIESINSDIYNLKVIKKFIKNTLETQDDSIEVDYGNDEIKKMLKEIAAHPNVGAHYLLLGAILNRNFSIVSILLEIGCAIDFGCVGQGVNHWLSRLIPTLEVEQALLVLKLYTAPDGVEKIKLEDSAIYSDGTSFSNQDVFAAVCSGYNIERFTKKKLLNFVLSLPSETNLQYLFANGHIKPTKAMLLSAIETAKNNKNFAIEQWLIRFFEDKYGDVVSASEKAHSLTPLERIKKEWSYTVVDCEAYIKSYKGNSSTVIVPSVIAGKPVTKIDFDAFSPEASRITAERKQQRNNIEEIVLPKGFTGFYKEPWRHDCAQFGRNFKRFVIPEDSSSYSYELLGQLLDIADVENVTKAGEFVESEGVVYTKDYSIVIGTKKNNRIKKYVMPTSVKFIAKGLWKGFTELEDLTITSQIRVYKNENSYANLYDQFSNMKKLKKVTVSGMEVFPNDLLRYVPNLEEVFIHEGIKKIEKYAFTYCRSIRKLTIPRSCTEIGDYIFPGTINERLYGTSGYLKLPDGFVVYCYEGSYAEQYAKEENAPFAYIKE